MEDQVECSECGWQGYEEELVVGYYESYNESNPVKTNCPLCESERIIYN